MDEIDFIAENWQYLERWEMDGKQPALGEGQYIAFEIDLDMEQGNAHFSFVRRLEEPKVKELVMRLLGLQGFKLDSDRLDEGRLG